MSPVTTAESALWPDEVVQLLDDNHLVVACNSTAAAERFADMLVRRLRQLSETQVVVIDGSAITDVPTFCRVIEKQIMARDERKALPQAKTWWRDLTNVISVLRHAPNSAPKHRYFIWSAADAAGGLLARDALLFSRLVNALLGVAAEQEHISPDPLVLQRAVFIGGEALERYAEDPRSALNRWLDEEGSPLWEVASVLERPPVVMYRLEGAGRG